MAETKLFKLARYSGVGVREVFVEIGWIIEDAAVLKKHLILLERSVTLKSNVIWLLPEMN